MVNAVGVPSPPISSLPCSLLPIQGSWPLVAPSWAVVPCGGFSALTGPCSCCGQTLYYCDPNIEPVREASTHLQTGSSPLAQPWDCCSPKPWHWLVNLPALWPWTRSPQCNLSRSLSVLSPGALSVLCPGALSVICPGALSVLCPVSSV